MKKVIKGLAKMERAAKARNRARVPKPDPKPEPEPTGPLEYLPDGQLLHLAASLIPNFSAPGTNVVYISDNRRWVKIAPIDPSKWSMHTIEMLGYAVEYRRADPPHRIYFKLGYHPGEKILLVGPLKRVPL